MPGGEWNREGGVAEAKAALRREAAERRAVLAPDLRERWSRLACDAAWSWMAEAGLSSLMAYAAFRTELDAGPLLERAWAAGLPVYLPRVAGREALEAVRVYSRGELSPGTLGIQEPAPSGGTDAAGEPFEPPAVILVPGLAFDAAGGRLGYGRGYYDRLLARLEAEASGSGRERPIRAGLCFSAQVVPEVPVDGNDAFMDLLITEKGIESCRGRI